MDPERQRLAEDKSDHRWRKWGPWVSDRQWGTVREDYSADGNAWDYFPHDHARSRAYRWGEDGLAGFCDDKQRLCLGIGLWNGKDPILKERLFGLTNAQGNHGEDVKELYWHQDATPTASYLRMLYKYPQRAYPYEDLIVQNRERGLHAREYELLDTEAFSDLRHFDVTVEYAKADPNDILWRVSVKNHGPEAATLHVLLQAWFRNHWSWDHDSTKPSMRLQERGAIRLCPHLLDELTLTCDQSDECLFCDNETNTLKCFEVPLAAGLHPKDAINDCVVNGNRAAVNPLKEGTKAAFVRKMSVPAGKSVTMRARLRPAAAKGDAFADFDSIFAQRQAEADAFYKPLDGHPDKPEYGSIQRQAFAGLLWNFQWYKFNIYDWLRGDPTSPPPPAERFQGRNSQWENIDAECILSMPDKWEYPWFASWDLAFQAVTLALIDPERAKRQLWQIVQPWMQHPDGQVPSYEWALGDVSPPVLAWAAYRIYQIEQNMGGAPDHEFLSEICHKLLLDFTWWVNRKDRDGHNIFEGGFLGLDNVGVFDRSKPLPTGGIILQSDGTAWVAKYCTSMVRIALELSNAGRPYQSIAEKFFEQFLLIAEAATNLGGLGIDLWDEEDQFFHDIVKLPDGRTIPIKVKSIVGLVPLFAVIVIDPNDLQKYPKLDQRFKWFLERRPDLASLISRWNSPGSGQTRLLSLLRGHRMKALLLRALDEKQFLSPYGIRSVSLEHKDHPYVLEIDGCKWELQYQPAESDTRAFGGNSNWRGPVWFPMNFLVVESLLRYYYYYGPDFKVECPSGSGVMMNLKEIALFLAKRMINLFLPGPDGVRPVHRDYPILDQSPAYKGNVHFYEYFDGDNGRGVGASHQTGWTSVIAFLLAPHEDQRISKFK
ncbi:MAG: glucosidase [Planctomycetes bacterium]|nr:glucosidase [Planctomycetota bacterium]